ncbi:MAG: hypothetical protein HN475_06970 [Piscirickettsiaceae bacterium]|jgi:hypothetical protein|nr:hypothetical protein [Piscirickettsiaceae bacterium]
MFGIGLGKHKKKLEQAFATCFWPLIDELGNVPIPMQTDPAINGAILGVCNTYSQSQNVTKPSDLLLIADAVFEEIYRLESINVQNRVDTWKNENNEAFNQAYANAKDKTSTELNLTWLTDFAKDNFEQATGLML